MAGNTIGRNFCVTTWGESHGPALGAVIDGCPAGLALCEADIQPYLDRRRPGRGEFSTKRGEPDIVIIKSGVFEGKTTGTPIALEIQNTDARSRDYTALKNILRPSHADFGYLVKYGHYDYRGGGRASGRETAARVAAGAVAAKVLSAREISFCTYVSAIGPVICAEGRADFDKNLISQNELFMPSKTAFNEAAAYLKDCMEKGDSTGGVVKCVISGVKPGVGSPVFDKLDASLGGAMFSIGGVKAVEFGLGVQAAQMRGSEYNDAFYANGGEIKKRANNAGGITGGLSDGGDIIITVHFKPTPSISIEQETVTKTKKNTTIKIKGRHDPIIAPRAAVVVESMAAIVLADALLPYNPSPFSFH